MIANTRYPFVFGAIGLVAATAGAAVLRSAEAPPAQVEAPPAEAGEPPGIHPVIAAAGDIAGGWDEDEETARVLDALQPDKVLTLGDTVYDKGTTREYERHYQPTWGRHLGKTAPSPGNHEHRTRSLSGYCDYHGAAAHCRGGIAYHAFDLGGWHLISLDSGCDKTSTCDPMEAGSEMRRWLAADLAANAKRCTLVYWHHPRFSSGKHGDDERSAEVWQELYDAGVDVVLNGHDHHYERFAPLDPDGNPDETAGIRQFIVGTGGTKLRKLDEPRDHSETTNDATHGVLKMTLRPDGYDWEFLPVAGSTWTDRGSDNCR
jgi:hypothetical protein